MYTRQICVSENQFNTTTSDLAIEEVYTNLDIAPNDMYLPYEGYVFCYPQRWLDDPSQNKVIGIRRLNIAATTHTFNFAVIIEDGEVTKYGTKEEVFPTLFQQEKCQKCVIN